jgi:hypothetical protein
MHFELAGDGKSFTTSTTSLVTHEIWKLVILRTVVATSKYMLVPPITKTDETNG